jgi:tRNA G10  N-methylase Trm11
MHRYSAVFGKTPALSFAEILAVLKREDIPAKMIRVSARAVIFESPKKLNPGFWDALGGVIKAGEIIAETKTAAVESALEKTAIRELTAFSLNQRCVFGVSAYALEDRAEKIAARIREQAIKIKHGLKKIDIASRLVTSREDALSAVVIKKNHLLDEGAEFCVFVDAETAFIGRTTWIQDYEKFAEREFGRPKANAVSGMLPLKLARILLNLAAEPRDSLILDPFCGSGTIALEALDLGYQEFIGSDASAEDVTNAEQNLAWYKNQFQNTGQVELLVSPVETLPEKMKSRSITAIVTEPYLGPPLRGRKTLFEFSRSRAALAELYLGAFQAFAKILKKGALVVFVFPRHVSEKRGLIEEITDKINELGFVIQPAIPERFAHTPGFVLGSRGGLIYSRPEQKIAREITIFRKT